MSKQSATYVGKICGYLNLDVMEPPYYEIEFMNNGALMLTVGNQNYMPTLEDIQAAWKEAIALGKIFGITQDKVVVGAWMGRIDDKKKSKKNTSKNMFDKTGFREEDCEKSKNI